MPISINQIAVGMGLKFDGDVYVVLDSKHVKPGKGGAFAKVKVKNVKTQRILEKTLRSSDKVDEAELEERKLQNLYRSGNDFTFMDLTTYDQITLSVDIIGEDVVNFLQENLEVTGVFYNDSVLQIVLPIFITAQITKTEPGLKGDSSKAGTKPATIDTGAVVQVPLFVDNEEWVKIDTRTGVYVERVKK